MKWKWWEHEEPEPSIMFPIKDLEAQIALLPKDPNVVYVLWWERMLNPAHIKMVGSNFERKGLNVIILAGCPIPEIYKLQRGEEHGK